MAAISHGRRRHWFPGPAQIVALVVGVATIISLVAAPASDARSFSVGFADYLYGEQAEQDVWLDRTQQVNADLIRVNMYWSLVAPHPPENPRDPADPSYDWETIDSAITGAVENGFQVELTVTAAPRWAEGPNRPPDDRPLYEEAPPGSWRPDAKAFGDFAHAVAVRYSGTFSDGERVLPAIRYFQAWNEPNIAIYITPQWVDGENTAVPIYAKLLNAFYDEVKAVNPDAKVITGGTAPYGDPPGGARTSPIRFYQELLCLDSDNQRAECPNGEAPRFDILAHHPINGDSAPTEKAPVTGDVQVADFRTLVDVLRAAEELGTPAVGGRHHVWADEVWWRTNPPDRGNGVSLNSQARFMSQSLYLLWRQGASNVSFLQLRDAQFTPPALNLPNYQTGVYNFDGTPKPSARAIAFPFVTDERSNGLLAWGRAPASGWLKIEAKPARGGGYKRVTRLPVTAGKVFKRWLRLDDSGKYVIRATVAGQRSRPWVQRWAER